MHFINNLKNSNLLKIYKNGNYKLVSLLTKDESTSNLTVQ